MKVIRSASRAVGYVAVVTVIALMLLTVADVFLRYVFNNPIRGTIELTEMMMVWILLVVAWGALEGSHVKIDILMRRFSPRVQATVEIFTWRQVPRQGGPLSSWKYHWNAKPEVTRPPPKSLARQLR